MQQQPQTIEGEARERDAERAQRGRRRRKGAQPPTSLPARAVASPLPSRPTRTPTCGHSSDSAMLRSSSRLEASSERCSQMTS
jgi:hypothetical protein